jgi:tripartite-type tricarboxylate transporter receptor subunit TctC
MHAPGRRTLPVDWGWERLAAVAVEACTQDPPRRLAGLRALRHCFRHKTIRHSSWEDNAMLGMTRALALLALLAPLAAAGAAVAQDYPTRPIRAIVSQGAGGLSDIWMRAVADQMGPILGGTVVVEARVGAGGSIGARACGESAPDGYTFCILPAEPIVYNPVINPIAGFDPKTSLTPITRAFYLTQVFAVTGTLQVKSFDQLAALAKAKPKTLTYMAASLQKVAFVEEFNKKHGVDFVRVPFKGGGDAINSMMTGTTPVAIFGIGNLINLIREGKIVGLAVDGENRSPLAPDIPTFKQVGYTKHLSQSFFGIYAPTGTPKPIIDKLHAAIVKVASNPEFQKKHMESRGLTAVLNTPEQFAKELVNEHAEALAAIKDSGLYPHIK